MKSTITKINVDIIINRKEVFLKFILLTFILELVVILV